MERIEEQERLYRRIGFGTRIGFGERPALLLIDFARGITEPGGPMSIPMDAEVAATARLLAAARGRRVPVVHTTVAYTPGFKDGGTFVRKVPALRLLEEGRDATQIDPRLAPAPGEIVLVKKFASAFYGTTLQSLLASERVDTVIVTGNSTSGCVRATVVDACSGGFRVIVPRECVADRVALSHEVNLFDMDSKYADVVPAGEVLAYLERLPAGLFGA